jgi:hypothetical protein
LGPIATAVFPTGTGQLLDIFQRANFAKPVSTHSGYHLLLGTPTVKSLMSIAVPASAGKAVLVNGHTVGLLDIAFLEGLLNNLIAAGQYSTGSLTIFVVGNVFEYVTNTNTCCIGGFHFASSEGLNQVATFIYTADNQSGIFSSNAQDITITSHEVAEWANDPLGTNIVPPWGLPQSPGSCLSDLLEVGDAIENYPTITFTVSLNSVTYHPQDLAFYSCSPQYFNRAFTFFVINSKLVTADEKADYESFDGGCHVFIIQRSNPICDQRPYPDNRTAVEGPIL